ncbi:hypothetical protein BDA99DRAFT_600041 [Phascolomyces articulosus]|uniref:Heterokaryon incompatibility domain-containing protein n=1 Tax=Phascolomyces articulosus TaxID=60185 RepID=A0AAD5PM24_9FUNG|nr:hypothetical protein BDA99DRAFT_600041 [Phascolomyces articulosus]
MPIIYETTQWTRIRNPKLQRMQIGRFTQPPKTVPTSPPKPEFMPSKLVRICDMQIVPGSEVNEGYCALSYVWSQSCTASGDEKKNNVDKNEHIIIQPITKTAQNATIQDNVQGIIDGFKNYFFQSNPYQKFLIRLNDEKSKIIEYQQKHVSFEQLIQQICQQFNINYLWYDQMCIDQDNLEEKHREIQQMHQVYKHAHCTVSLVPEFQTTTEEVAQIGLLETTVRMKQSEWFKRLWTLMEAIHSNRMVIIGKNVHLWSDDVFTATEIPLDPLINTPLEQWHLSDILFCAHIRTCMLDHDRIYALANLFPDTILQQLKIDQEYKKHQSLEDLMVQLYCLLAERDITILLFGGHGGYKAMGKISDTPKNNDDDDDKDSISKSDKNAPPILSAGSWTYQVPIQKYSFLPSWTGIAGEHFYQHKCDYAPTKHPFQDYCIEGRIMRITCIGLTNSSEESMLNTDRDYFTPMRFEDLPPFSSTESSIDDGYVRTRHLGLKVDLPGQNELKNIYICDYDGYISEEAVTKSSDSLKKRKTKGILHLISLTLQRLSKFIKIKKQNLFWYPSDQLRVDVPEFNLSILTEIMDLDPTTNTQYVMLTGIPFKGYKSYTYYPVIKKIRGGEKNHYTAIGACCLYKADEVFSSNDCTPLPKHTYLIE